MADWFTENFTTTFLGSPPYDVDAGDLKIWALGLLLGGHLSVHLAGENHGHTLECQGKSMPKACGGMRNNACVML